MRKDWGWVAIGSPMPEDSLLRAVPAVEIEDNRRAFSELADDANLIFK
jgi:hypothetical protein